MDRMQKEVYLNISSNKNISTENLDQIRGTCPICFDDLAGKKAVSLDACDHIFCYDCLQKWSKLDRFCPVDRKVFRKIVILTSGITIKVKNPKKKKKIVLYDVSRQCEVCSLENNGDTLLFCDCCDLSFHCRCLNPPLIDIPSCAWYCPSCMAIDRKLKRKKESSKKVKLGLYSSKDSKSTTTRQFRTKDRPKNLYINKSVHSKRKVASESLKEIPACLSDTSQHSKDNASEYCSSKNNTFCKTNSWNSSTLGPELSNVNCKSKNISESLTAFVDSFNEEKVPITDSAHSQSKTYGHQTAKASPVKWEKDCDLKFFYFDQDDISMYQWSDNSQQSNCAFSSNTTILNVNSPETPQLCVNSKPDVLSHQYEFGQAGSSNFKNASVFCPPSTNCDQQSEETPQALNISLNEKSCSLLSAEPNKKLSDTFNNKHAYGEASSILHFEKEQLNKICENSLLKPGFNGEFQFCSTNNFLLISKNTFFNTKYKFIESKTNDENSCTLTMPSKLSSVFSEQELLCLAVRKDGALYLNW